MNLREVDRKIDPSLRGKKLDCAVKQDIICLWSSSCVQNLANASGIRRINCPVKRNVSTPSLHTEWKLIFQRFFNNTHIECHLQCEALQASRIAAARVGRTFESFRKCCRRARSVISDIERWNFELSCWVAEFEYKTFSLHIKIESHRTKAARKKFVEYDLLKKKLKLEN